MLSGVLQGFHSLPTKAILRPTFCDGEPDKVSRERRRDFSKDALQGGELQLLILISTFHSPLYSLQVESRPEAKVVWRQGVREVREELGRRGVTDGRESELVLDIVRREELGSYTCAAKNSLGEASALLILPGDLLSGCKNHQASVLGHL